MATHNGRDGIVMEQLLKKQIPGNEYQLPQKINGVFVLGGPALEDVCCINNATAAEPDVRYQWAQSAANQETPLRKGKKGASAHQRSSNGSLSAPSPGGRVSVLGRSALEDLLRSSTPFLYMLVYSHYHHP